MELRLSNSAPPVAPLTVVTVISVPPSIAQEEEKDAAPLASALFVTTY